MRQTRIAHAVHAKTFAAQMCNSQQIVNQLCSYLSQIQPQPEIHWICVRHAIFHLIPLQLKEVVEIVGVQGRAQVRCGSLAETEIRVGRVGLGSERVKSAGLVGVL